MSDDTCPTCGSTVIGEVTEGHTRSPNPRGCHVCSAVEKLEQQLRTIATGEGESDEG